MNLGQTGLLPEKESTINDKTALFNNFIDQISKIPFDPVRFVEVDEEALSKEIQKYFGIIEVHPDDMTKFDVAKTVEKLVNWSMTNGLAQALASNPSAWLKRKE